MVKQVNQEQGNNQQQHISLDNDSLSNRPRSSHPLSEALAALPQQYLRAVTRPSVRTYTQERNKASWSLVCIQLLIWAVLDAALGVLVNLISPPATGFSSFFSLATSLGLLVLVPILFFMVMGVTYFIARFFGGQGTFLEQCDTSLTVQVPLGIGSKLLALIPVVGRILNSVLSIYGLILQGIVLMAVHKLSRGKAIATMLVSGLAIAVPAGVLYALYLLLVHK
ncbi:MAG: hypothetical protein NVS4B7_12770 [Ktedonobacteraceae bacterium]